MIAYFIAGIIVGAVLAAVFINKTTNYSYAEGYKEGWLDAKERYIKKIRQIGNQELVDNFVNSLREP